MNLNGLTSQCPKTLQELINSVRGSLTKIATVTSDWDGYDGYYMYKHDNIDASIKSLKIRLDEAEKHCISNPELCEFTVNTSKPHLTWKTKRGDKYALTLHKDGIQMFEDAEQDGSTSIINYNFKQ
jgi:hypothetical protein